MFNTDTGQFSISDDLVINPGYSFDQFKLTHFYNGQDGIRTIQLPEEIELWNHRFIVTLFFRNHIIYLVDLYCVDPDCDGMEEPKMKSYHDNILIENGFQCENQYSWGKIISSCSPRDNIASIIVLYDNKRIADELKGIIKKN